MKKLLIVAMALTSVSPALAQELPKPMIAPPAYSSPPPPASSVSLPGLFGPGPLVNTVIGIGVQTTAQTGSGNAATNVLDLGQFSAPAAPGGGLVNTNLGLGVQTNAQTGHGNGAVNGLGLDQRLSAFPFPPPPR